MMSGNMFDLTGKVVLATGANAGIGLGFLRGCAKQGAAVVVWSRRADRNAAALEELKALGAPRVHAESVDVSDEVAVAAAFAATLKAMGRVDCVFANAGFSSSAPSFPDMTSEMYHSLLNVNQHGAFYTLREATRHMRARAGRRSGRFTGRLRKPDVISGAARPGTLRRLQGRACHHDQRNRG
jgi:NAD(P)-dependent dehydrogenase (short-subunit alcohol dehydrogenase family)